MILAIALIAILVVPLPWEITFAVAWFSLGDGDVPPQWVQRGPHFRQPYCALKGRCAHA